MIESGFFDAVEVGGSYDRTYNAESFNTFFEGIIDPYGVFANVDNEFGVSPGSGLAVNVGSGKAVVNNYWIRSTDTESVSLAAADVVLNRYDAIILRLTLSTRSVVLTKITGTPASNPSRPQISRGANTKDILLAYVYVGAGATQITAANITDMRGDRTVCGYVGSLIYTETSHINHYAGRYTTTSTTTRIPITVSGYTYNPADIFIFNINGVILEEGIDFTKTGSGQNIVLTMANAITAGNTISVMILQSVIDIS